MIAKEAEGFLYCVSSLGVTGCGKEITTNIGEMIDKVREVTDIPCAVGFGISTPEQAKEMAALLIRGKTITWGAGEGFVYPKGQNIPLQLQFQETESPDGKKGTLWFAIPQSDGKEVQILHLYPKNVYLAQAAGNIRRKKKSKRRSEPICSKPEYP